MTTTPEQVICGQRETRPDRAHYWVRLNTSKEAA